MSIDISFLDELNRFRIALKRKVISKYQGESESTIPGEGLVFKDFSPYSLGDDYRAIDWNVYARTEKLFIRRFEEEKNMIMHIIIDASSSMKFGKPIQKFDYAAMIGVGFAYMNLKDNGRFNFATFSDKLEVLKSEQRNLAKIVEHINRLKIGGKTKLVDSMEKYKKNIQSKSIIVIISDFLYDIEEIKEILLRYKKNYVYLIQVLDPVEVNLSIKGDVILKDMEEDLSLRTYISSRMRNKYKERLNEHIMELGDLCDDFKDVFITITTNESIFDAFFKILYNRR